ncbi:bifunctional phosphoribosyl-AMP cyclohydrolase/phosphoribosyl-ATP diphosphatase HisIE [Candidatus Gracilibacteria bacterium]|nr:bifunctional phosphoribosyl-AMP cyclohydrolase/phosphoribosyl-ATP diphosphatase HisIE [Candidatus Gracilibacteria bacterium]
MKTTQKKISLANYKKLNFQKGQGLVAAVVQDNETREVLMMAYMNEASIKKTLASKNVTFFSRSRNTLWTKGETSGNFLKLVSMYSDCDGDSLVVFASPVGPTCHTGTRSCFIPPEGNDNFLTKLQAIIFKRKKEMPKGSYTTELFESGLARITQKVGEEAIEVVIAANDTKKKLVSESADLLYHLLVLLAQKGTSIEEVTTELSRRHK